METVDVVGMRVRNARILLRLIWQQPEISRADLARLTGLSASTVSAIVGDLVKRGIVRLVRPGASSGGRPPIMVDFEAGVFGIAGVEIGATHITVALTDLRGRVLATVDTPFPTRTDPAGTIAKISEMVAECRAAAPDSSRLLGAGVAVPSPVDPSRPGELSELILPAWAGVDLVDELEKSLGLPIFIENDANAGALAERWFGDGGDDFTYVKVGTGIGAGHVIRGELYRGSGGLAGEIGHFSIDRFGPECVCGNRGCLNVMAGTPSLLSRAASMTNDALTSARDIVVAADQGEQWAKTVLDEVGTQLGIGIAGLLNLLNPSKVIFGGELVEAGENLLGPLRESARSRSLLFSNTQAEIIGTSLGTAAIAIGAAALALDAALESHGIFDDAKARGVA
ncbi:MAG: putative NBD/HSP70 family sugar kinase [Bradymonadia bacterium]|jgi:predicted NBD/HSP70 family sugar kinase